MTEPERQPDPIAALLHRAVELNDAERLAARHQFLERVDRERPRSRTTQLVGYAAALALAASVLLGLALWRSQGGLEYTVQGAMRDGDYVQAAPDHPADITFSDRTRIHASEGARLRIDDAVERTGARVSVERGRLDVEVTHTESTSWRFKAGPFQVGVTGTRFTLDWEANTEQLEVTLHAGSVDIEGYAGSGAVSVHAGQRFLGDARQRTMLVSDIPAPGEPSQPLPSTPAPAIEPPPSPEPTPAVSRPIPSPRAPAGARPSWSELVAQGAFRRVVEAATARGTSECLASCTADDLNALADAARYVGQAELAERALLGLRARYGSEYGARAAFLLGRLHESKADMAPAREWYETALREDARGAFASEALSGKMRTVNALEGRVAARAIAREYLRLYPTGVHAGAAKELAGGP